MSNAQIIWDFLKGKGLTDFAAAGLMGNLYAESALNPGNLQNTYEKKFGLTDKEYTEQVDNGTYTNFAKDSGGYGLAQWTWHTRKQGLLDLAKKNKTSIGDMNTQLEYLWYEISGHYKTAVLNPINKATSVREASDIVLTQYERPSDQGEAMREKRANYGMKYYIEFATTTPKDTLPLTGPGGLAPEYQDQDTLNEPIQRFTNSDLVELSMLSPNCNKNRNHTIDTITIHCLVGQATLENALEWFSRPSTEASCNYVIDKDGRIGLCVEEKDRSWCTSSRSNDHRAITIEVASDKTHPYAVNNKAYEALIVLLADICKRNNIKSLKWKADKNLIGQVDKQNMTVHRWFANKSCPGEYLYTRHSEIADRVNTLLGVVTPADPTPAPSPSKTYWYRVRKSWENASSQIGAYSNYENAVNACKKAGPEYKVFDEEGKALYPDTQVTKYSFTVGQEVKLVPGSKYSSGQPIPSWLFDKEKLYVRKDNGDGSYVFSTLASGAVTGIVYGSALVPYEANSNKEYVVQITAAALNVRSGPGSSNKVVTQVKKDQTYTICEEKDGWGKLKNGKGWISLAYTKKV